MPPAMIAARSAGGILELALQLAPIPYLEISLSIFKALYTSIQHVRGIRAQMRALAALVAQLLYDLNIKLGGLEHLDESILHSLQNFNILLTDICDTADRYSKHSNLKIFFTPVDIQKLIDEHHKQITQVTSSFQTHIQLTIHNDIRKFEEARKEDHQEVLRAIQKLEKREFVQAAESAMRKEESPLTEKEINDYFATVDNTSDERELDRAVVNRMLKCLNRASVYVVPQYQGSISSGWSPTQYTSNDSPNYSYMSAEPETMSEAETQLPQNRPYPPRRPVFQPNNVGYPPQWPHNEAYAPRAWASNGYNGQPPYNSSSQGSMQMPTPHHYTMPG